MGRLLEQLQTDLGRPEIDFILGRLSDYGNNRPDDRPGWNAIRQIQVDFATRYPRGGWVDTDDLNGEKDDLHYNAAGYRTLGERFAHKAIELIRNKGKGAAAATRP